MTIEEIFESKPIQYTGRISVVLAIVLNFVMSSWVKGGALKQFIINMDINNALVIITSILGILFLVIKISTSWVALVEKVEERIVAKKRVPKILLWLTRKKVSQKND